MWPYLGYDMHLLAHLVSPVLARFRPDIFSLVVLVEVVRVGTEACPSSAAFSSPGNSKAIGTTGTWIGEERTLVSFFKQDPLTLYYLITYAALFTMCCGAWIL